jgi:ComF family protein
MGFLLSLLGPDRCAACDEPIGPSVVLCGPCARTVERAPAASPAPFLYGGALATAITRFKYDPMPELARPLGKLLAYEATRLGVKADVVVPVPLHPTRLFERGFNQAALLARPVARAIGAAFRPRALARVRATDQQAELDRSKRLTNVAGAFRVRQPVHGGAVLLVDDVRTTGATQDECAHVLRAAGCPRVECLVLAIAPPIAYP